MQTKTIVLLALLAIFQLTLSIQVDYEGVSRPNWPLLNQQKQVRSRQNIDFDVIRKTIASQKHGFAASNDTNPFKHSGHIKVSPQGHESQYYYLFFENHDENAPIILWLNGGPGCSSMEGAFDENVSPFSIRDGRLQKSNSSWSEFAHTLFIDNPVGAGFSFSEDRNYHVHNQEEMAENLYATLIGFFSLYPQYQKNDFFVFGESYAGKYIPSIAYKIKQEGYKINLKGIGVGDGLTDPINQMGDGGYSTYAYATQLVDENSRDEAIQAEKKAEEAIRAKDWNTANQYWGQTLNIIGKASGNVNVYDIRVHHPYDSSGLTKFLNDPETQKQMHTTGVRWQECDGPTYQALANDIPQSVAFKVKDLLEEGRIRLMFYEGQMDLIINTVMAQNWIWKLDWSGQSGYHQSQRKPFYVNKDLGGYHRSYKTLVQVGIANAGHMVPKDNPEAAQHMAKMFVKNQPF